MKKDLTSLLTTLFFALATTMSAQTDVSKYFISNYGFDDNFNYSAESNTAVAQEILEIPGWTKGFTVDYTIAGVYQFGFQGTFNGGSVPAKGYDDEAGGGLALSTGWEQEFSFSQTVTLPAGTYKVNVPTYNGYTATAGTSRLAWIPSSGSSVTSSVSSYPSKEWTLDHISFTLTKATTGSIRIGYKAGAGGSTGTANLVIDYVQLLAENMAVDKSSLQSTIASAQSYYGEGSGNDAAALSSAISTAQGVYDDESADMISVLEATSALNAAIEIYRKANVSEENPLDYTSYISNPSFEKGTTDWTSAGLASQSNSAFTKKGGTVYMEKWVQSGSAGDASIRQVVKDLPNGKYKLTVAAQNYSQSNTTKKNTGAYIFAGDQQTIVYTPNDYSVTFTSIAGQVEIGFVAEGATGNWLAVDNFRLYLIGYVDDTELIGELERLKTSAESLLSEMMSDAAKSELQAQISAAQAIVDNTNEYSSAVTLALQEATAAAEESISEYKSLQAKIDEVQASYDESKQGAAEFQAEIAKANGMMADGTLTSEDIQNEISALDRALLAFRLANAEPGTGVAPAVTSTNHYIATGSTEALVRANMTGGNILERGVCWSTEREPTVLDNRTTEYHTLNGYIFHIRNLTPATVYYVRPYVMNKTYTVAYGDEVKIVTHPKGTCVGTWNEGAPTEDANARCRNAIAETIEYFNQWTGIRGFTLTGSYGSGTATADCSYGGSMRIGPNAGNQAIGTVIHETGHGVGVGTHWRWYDCSDTRENQGKYGKWLGREANDMLHFLENKYTDETCFMTGDAVHGWGNNATYDWFVNGADKDTHTELQYMGGCCLLYALFIDGLCPTDGYPNGLSGYTYNFDSDKKYYLMNKSEARGLGEGLLFQRSSTAVAWKPYLSNEEISDSAAWYIEYNPTQGYYIFKNAMSGKYLTHASSGSNVTLRTTATPTRTEYFQLMPDRTDVTISGGSESITTHGYWFTWNDGSNKSMSAGAMGRSYGTVPQATFNFSDSATDQQWIIISEDELEQYKQIALATDIVRTYESAESGERAIVVAIYNAAGVQQASLQKGVNIVKYSDGSIKKIYK